MLSLKDNPEISKAGCVILNEKKEVLLTFERNKNAFTFPKGHVEPNETLEEAAKRETFEETGYTVKLIKRLPDVTYSHPDKRDSIRLALFQAQPLELIGKPEEHIKFKWASLKEAKEIIYPNLSSVLDNINL